MNAYVREQDTASKTRMFIIDDQFVIHKVSESLQKYFEQKWHRSLTGRICYAALFNSDSPCKNCPVVKCFSFNQDVQSIVSAHSARYDVSRYAKATPVQDAHGQVRQVIVECLTPVNDSESDKGSSSAEREYDPTQITELNRQPKESGYVLMNPELKVLLHNKGIRSYCRQPYIIGRHLYEAVPLFDQPGIRYQIDMFLTERSDSLEFYTRTQDDHEKRILSSHSKDEQRQSQ
ncbi:MAG: hypothetical protein U5R06_09845 [candidate division KSB1 bacterium]|nr:hypothetical protein [candidate division KSB1 bacterium]